MRGWIFFLAWMAGSASAAEVTIIRPKSYIAEE